MNIALGTSEHADFEAEAFGTRQHESAVSGTTQLSEKLPVKTGVISRFYLDPGMFEVRFGDGTLAKVKVERCDHLRVGMEVPVRLIDVAQTNLYELARPLPRYPGRW